MRSVLCAMGPWPLWAYPIIVVVISLPLALWRRVEQAMSEQERQRRTSLLGTALAVLGIAAGLHILVNHFAPIQIHSYGVMLIVAVVAGVWWMTVSARAYGISDTQWIDFALFMLIGGIIGARVLFVILNWEQYAGAPLAVFSVWEGGLSYLGGIAGALVSAYLFSRQRGIDFKLLADVGAPATALGYSLARIGCFLNGCCYGHACSPDWPLGMVFPPGTDAGTPQVPIHPTQLYASFASILIFYVLVKVQPYIKVRGNLFLFYLLLYSVYRFLVEFLRRGASAQVFALMAPLTEAQTASIIIGATALVWILVSRSRTEANA